MSHSESRRPGSAPPPPPERELPPVDFTTLVMSLSTSAMAALGLVADPRSGERTECNLPLARHTIDLLALLEEKTRGNLTGEEERLLGQVLYDLRMCYVRACEAAQRKGKGKKKPDDREGRAVKPAHAAAKPGAEAAGGGPGEHEGGA